MPSSGIAATFRAGVAVAPLGAMNSNSGDHARSAELLRTEAKRLRRLAERLLDLDALRLDRAAGPNTWSGPRAALCERLLESSRSQIERATEQLLDAARRCERQADDEEQRSREALLHP
jgi:hypothetical protein